MKCIYIHTVVFITILFGKKPLEGVRKTDGCIWVDFTHFVELLKLAQ